MKYEKNYLTKYFTNILLKSLYKKYSMKMIYIMKKNSTKIQKNTTLDTEQTIYILHSPLHRACHTLHVLPALYVANDCVERQVR